MFNVYDRYPNLRRPFGQIDPKSLSERHINYSFCFNQSLIDAKTDATRLLERLSIRIPGNTRNKDFFYIPLGRSNFAKNAPLSRMMSIFNKNQ
ncbi:Uncharacterized protein FWK35_00018732 [Aphis craccivora]|uniref:Uncharacterized protein n=1 Tax=Aphis craccivora TaxID=307492 RepID=A0A6G0YGQ8_APHCR|nr:Uncharacterized protein FWK35_00018732 [Aphis craccivora]